MVVQSYFVAGKGVLLRNDSPVRVDCNPDGDKHLNCSPLN